MSEKMYRHRRGRILKYDPWNFDAEPGDKMVTDDGRLLVLTESTGYNQSRAGVLTYRTVKPPTPEAKAIIRNGDIWWAW